MPLRLLVPFLEGSVRLVVEQARNAAVVRSLRRSENLQIREDLTKSKQRYAVSCRRTDTLPACIDKSTVCRINWQCLANLPGSWRYSMDAATVLCLRIRRHAMQSCNYASCDVEDRVLSHIHNAKPE